jgi:hypothetical protein
VEEGDTNESHVINNLCGWVWRNGGVGKWGGGWAPVGTAVTSLNVVGEKGIVRQTVLMHMCNSKVRHLSRQM